MTSTIRNLLPSRRAHARVLALFYFSGYLALAQSPVALSNIAPDSFRVGDTVSVNISRIPAGQVNLATTLVELAPRDASVGPPVSINPDTLTAIPGGTDRQLRFRIPSSLRNASPYSIRVSVRGFSGAVSFASSAPRILTILPDPRVSSVSPSAASLGQNFTLEIRGKYTQFQANTVTGVSFDGSGVTVNSFTIDVPNQVISASISVSPSAATGPRALRVNMLGGAQLSLIDALYILSAPARSVSIANPSFCNPGDTARNIRVSGSGTRFTSAPSAVFLGDGIVVTNVATLNDTTLDVVISCDRLATPGTRALTVVTGSEFSLGPNSFTVNSSGATLINLTPASGLQGQTLTNLIVTAANSSFVDGATSVTMTRPGSANLVGGGVTVLSATQLRLEIAISSTSTVGDYTLNVQTGGEQFSAPGAFRVDAASPEIQSVTPSTAVQNTNVTVRVNARFFNFIQGITSADFGPGIAVNTSGITTTPSPSGPQIQFPITIAPTATLGQRTVTLTTGSTILSFPFNVTSSPASISVNPNVGFQGQTLLRVGIVGAGTTFLNGTTTVSLLYGSSSPLPITRVEVTSPTALNFDLYIPTAAPVINSYALVVQTGGQIVTLPNAFQVLAATPVITLNPSSIPQGLTSTVVITGQFSNFNASSLVAINPADDITLGTPQLISSTEMRVPVTVGPLAFLPNTPNRYLSVSTTVPSPAGDYPENLSVSFSPTRGAAQISSITPNSGVPGQVLDLIVSGAGTHFTAGLSQLSLCGGLTVLTNPATVTSATALRAQVRVEATASPTTCPVQVTTRGETALLQNAFTIIAVSGPSISGLSTNAGAQGQSLTVDVVTSNFTVNANTTASFGDGITVNQVTALNATTARVSLTVRPTAPLGNRPITLTTGAQSVTSSSLQFSVTPGIASLTSLVPNSGRQGQTLSVAITGANSNFLAGLTTASFGAGITVNSLSITSATSATALITVARTNPLGLKTVTLSTEGELASISNGFNVTAAVPQLLSITPSRGRQGQSISVTVFGEATGFNSNSLINLGAGVTQSGQPTVNSDSSLTFNIEISPLANTSPRNLRVTTGVQVLDLPNAFTVDAGSATLTSVSPAFGVQGQNLVITVTGQNTHFAQGVTTAQFSNALPYGITIGGVTVTSPTSAQVSFSIANNATTGLRGLTLTTEGEQATLASVFRIDPGTPALTSAAPNTSSQGTTLDVTLNTRFTRWTSNPPTVSFGQGITVNNVIVIDDETVRANIAVGALASTGGRAVTISGGGTVLSASIFNVTAGPARILSVAPSTAQQGQSLTITLTGDQTHFDQNITSIGFGGGITVTAGTLTVVSPTQLTAQISIPANATAGTYAVSAVTGGEALSLAGAFTITGGTPAISGISPGSAVQGATATVSISGAFTNWLQGATTLNFGPGITVSNVTVSNPFNIEASLDLAANATVGARAFTVTTGAQNLTNSFTVTSSAAPPSISLLSPSQAAPGQTLTISIVGTNTNFLQGTTTATFGGGIVVNTLTVISPTLARAQLTIDPAAAAGPRGVTVTTAAEVLSSSFSVVIGTPRILSINPAIGPQGTTQTIQVNAELTTFLDTTTFDFGPGTTVISKTINSPVSASVQLQIAPIAPVGSRNVTATTGTQIATGPNSSLYTITPSSARLVSSSPSRAKQGEGPFALTITGENTNFTTGLTALSIPGVTLTNIVITSSTRIDASATVLPTAAVGPASTQAITSGEVATLSGGFLIDPGVPTLLSSTPSSARQQETFTLLVQGRFTAFNTGTAAVSLGPGVTITSTSVNNSGQLTVAGRVDNRATAGLRTLTLTGTSDPTLTLPNSFSVTAGPAAINSVAPATAKQGDTQTIAVTGTATNFSQGLTSASFGPGVSIGSVTVNSPTSATVVIGIASDAPVSIRNVTLTTEGEIAQSLNAFTVELGTPIIRTVTPNSLKQGQTAEITITGLLTNWAQGATTLTLGSGILVNSLTIDTATRVRASLTIDPTTATGLRALTLTTGAEVVSLPDAFTVASGDASLTTATPSSIQRGKTTSITITGTGTNFGPTSTIAFSGADITAGAITVNSAISLTVPLTVGPAALLTARNITVTTGAQVATGTALLTIAAGDPTLLSVTPATGQQGATLTPVTISARDFILDATPVTLSLGAGITATVLSAVSGPGSDTIQATLVLQPRATIGVRSLTATQGARNITLPAAFTLARGPAAITSITPASARQGDTVDVTVTGVSTTFLAGTTSFSVGTGITLSQLNITGPTSFTARLAIADSATPGGRTPTATTDGETAELTNGFTVNAGLPLITLLTPNTAAQGANFTLQLTSRFTNFSASTSATFGAGVTINSISAATPTTLTLTGVVSPTATAGLRNLTLTTGGEVVTLADAFTITSGASSITVVTPSSLAQGDAQTLSVTGLGTAFAQGTSVVTFSGVGITPGTVTVTSPTNLTVAVTVADDAPVGARNVTVTTAGQVAVSPGGLTLTAGIPTLLTLSPNTAAQRQSPTVTFNTRFLPLSAPVTITFADPRIVASNITIVSPTQATASVSVAGPATLGAKNVTIGSSFLSATLNNGFTVTPGNASISAVTPSTAAQGVTVSLTVTGLNTSFENGLTTADLGAGVATTVTVTTPTQATISAVIAPTAAPGIRPLSLTTGGETATLASAFTIISGAPIITGISPAAGIAGQTTANITVTGINLAGSTFTLAGTSAPITATNVTATQATLSINGSTLTVGEYALVATSGAGASTSTIGAENRIIFILGSGSTWFTASVLNTFYDPNNIITPSLRSAYGANTAVFNTFFDTANSVYPVIRSAFGQGVSVLNTFFDTSNPTLSLRTAYGPNTSILNTFYTPGVTQSVPPGKNSAATITVTVRNAASAPDLTSLRLAPVAETVWTPGPSNSRTGALPLALGLEGKVYPGQTLRLQINDPDRRAGDLVDLLANSAVLYTLEGSDTESLFTVPYGVASIKIEVQVRGADGSFRRSSPVELEITPDPGLRLSGVVKDEFGGPVSAASLAVIVSGLNAEIFSFDRPLSAMPALEAATLARQMPVTALHQPNPREVFGKDPLGLGRTEDVVVRYRGWLVVEETNTHHFWLEATPGSTIQIDHERHAIAAGASGVTFEMPLLPGLHPVEILYWNGVGPQSLDWSMSLPGGIRRPVSPRVLRTQPVDDLSSSVTGAFNAPSLPLSLDNIWVSVKSGDARVLSPLIEPRRNPSSQTPLELTLPVKK